MTADAMIEKKEMNRREFLNFAWLVSLGFLMVDLAGVSYLFSMPRLKEGEFGGVVTLGEVGDIPEVGSPPVNYPKVKFWLANTQDGLMALYKVCTHLGCLYNWNSQEGKFICPCHGSQFQADGTYIRGPAPRSLDRFVIEVQSQDGHTLASTDPESGAAVKLPDQPQAIVKIDTGRRIIGKRHA